MNTIRKQLEKNIKASEKQHDKESKRRRQVADWFDKPLPVKRRLSNTREMEKNK
jgi:hypothetical protein